MTRDHLDEIIMLRSSGATLQEIGDQFGVTRERIRQLLVGRDPLRVKVTHYRRWFRAVGIAARLQARRDGGGSMSPCGSTTRYSWGCRCEECRATNNRRIRDLYRKRRAQGWKPPAAPPQQRRAHMAVQHAITAGTLVPAERCEECGTTSRPRVDGKRWIHAHHDDHSRPLDVVWLCPPCHKARHQHLKAAHQHLKAAA